jgi:hypothetical protein
MRSYLLLLALVVWAAPCVGAAPPTRARLDIHGEPLPEGATARFGALRLRDDYPHRFAFSPDGNTLALSMIASIRVWGLANGRLLSIPHLAGARGATLTFAPDGAHIVSDASGSRVLDPKSGAVRVWLVPPREGFVASEAVLFRDGKRAAVAWQRNTGS